MDAHTDPVVEAAHLILSALAYMSNIGTFPPDTDPNKAMRDRYDIDSKAGQRLIRAIAFMIADAAASQDATPRRDYTNEKINTITKDDRPSLPIPIWTDSPREDMLPIWQSLPRQVIEERLQRAVNDVVRDHPSMGQGPKDNSP